MSAQLEFRMLCIWASATLLIALGACHFVSPMTYKCGRYTPNDTYSIDQLGHNVSQDMSEGDFLKALSALPSGASIQKMKENSDSTVVYLLKFNNCPLWRYTFINDKLQKAESLYMEFGQWYYHDILNHKDKRTW